MDIGEHEEVPKEPLVFITVSSSIEQLCDVRGCWRKAEKTYGNLSYCGVHYHEYQDKGYIK